MSSGSDRFALPLLAAGQAQKEITHNEALTLIDFMMNPVVQSIGPATIPAVPLPGQCWIVGTAPSGAWTGQTGAIAGWTEGGWRFIAPGEGMSVWSLADSLSVRRTGGAWVKGVIHAGTVIIGGNQVVGTRAAAIAGPVAGQIVDAECRTAVGSILAILRTHGLIAG